MTELAPFVGPAHVTDLDDLGGSNVWGDGRIRVLRVIARLNVGGPALQTSVLSDMLDPDRFDQRIVAGSVGEAEGDYVSLRAPSPASAPHPRSGTCASTAR